MIVDAHVHLRGGVFPGDDRSGAAGLLEAMGKAGVDAAWVVGLEPEDSGAIFDACTTHPGKLVPFVVPELGAGYKTTIRAWASQRQIAGLGEIYLKCGASDVPEEVMRFVMQGALESGLPVLYHTGDFSYTAPLLVASIARAYPQVKVILGHMGSMAFVLDAIQAAKSLPNVYLETSGLPSPLMLRRAVAECGAEKVLFGSDYPYWHPTVELARIDEAALGAGPTRLVLGGNAGRLLG